MEYPTYMKSKETNQVIKIIAPCDLYLVQVVSFESGSFRHCRERIVFREMSVFEDFIKNFSPAVESDYTDCLKDLFAAEKQVRENFIKLLYGVNAKEKTVLEIVREEVIEEMINMMVKTMVKVMMINGNPVKAIPESSIPALRNLKLSA